MVSGGVGSAAFQWVAFLLVLLQGFCKLVFPETCSAKLHRYSGESVKDKAGAAGGVLGGVGKNGEVGC